MYYYELAWNEQNWPGQNLKSARRILFENCLILLAFMKLSSTSHAYRVDEYAKHKYKTATIDQYLACEYLKPLNIRLILIVYLVIVALYHAKLSVSFLVPLVQTFTARAQHATSTTSRHLHLLSISAGRGKVHFILLRTANL